MELSPTNNITPHQLFSLSKELQHYIHECCLQLLSENNWLQYSAERLANLEIETLQFLQSRRITSIQQLQQELPKLMNEMHAPLAIQRLGKYSLVATNLTPIQIEEETRSPKSSNISTPNNSEAGYTSEASDNAMMQNTLAVNEFEITLSKRFEPGTGAPKVIESIAKEANHTYILKRSVYILSLTGAIGLSVINLMVLFLMVAGAALFAAGVTRLQDIIIFCSLSSVECEALKHVGTVLSAVGLPVLLATFFIFWVLVGLVIVCLILVFRYKKNKVDILRDVIKSFHELELIKRFELIETESKQCIVSIHLQQ